MKAPLRSRYFLNAGTLCLTFGMILAASGAIRTFGFLSIVHTYQHITARELLVKLILPHMLLLFGIGLMTAAFILITRSAVIHSRSLHKEL